MLKIYSRNFMVFLNTLGSWIVLSSSSFVPLWIGMELTTLTLPPLLSSFNSSLTSKINSWKYFMIQCYASSMMFMALLCLSFSSQSSVQSNIGWAMIFFSMLVKMGILPFQGWLFQISSSISWLNFLILSTIQKIGPLILISESSMNLSAELSMELILSSSLSIITITGILINSIRHMMVMSSIVNTMWMIAASQVSKTSFISFIVFYFFHLLILFFFIKEEYSNELDEMYFFFKKDFSIDMGKILCVFSMIGLPPLLGFFVKMMVIDQMIQQQQIFSVSILVAVSSIIMLMYMKLLIVNSMNMKIQFIQFKTNFSMYFPVLLVFTSMFFFLS